MKRKKNNEGKKKNKNRREKVERGRDEKKYNYNWTEHGFKLHFSLFPPNLIHLVSLIFIFYFYNLYFLFRQIPTESRSPHTVDFCLKGNTDSNFTSSLFPPIPFLFNSSCISYFLSFIFITCISFLGKFRRRVVHLTP